MTRTNTITLAVAGFVAFAGVADASLVLSLDARNTTAGQWDDLSGNNSPFTPNSSFAGGAGIGDVNAGSAPTLATVGVGQVYDFNIDSTGPDFFASTVANNNNFDFDTAKGTGANPFSVVIYAAAMGSTDGTINKGRNESGGNWFADVQNNDAAELVFQPDNGGNRSYRRFKGPVNNSDENFHLYVFHHDGSGDNAGTSLYYDGSMTSGASENPIDGLNVSILNDVELHIGAMENFGSVNDWDGLIQFVEIYSGTTIGNNLGSDMSPAAYSQLRFGNLGATVIPEPGTLALLGLGGLMVLLRRRTK
jgi:hypothetical protein